MVSALLVNARGEVLLQLRDDRPGLLFAGHWTLPGGYVEPGETPDDAIRRELHEEMRIAPRLTYWKSYLAPRADYTVQQHLYTGRLDTPAADLPLHEGQALRFAARGEVEDLPLAFGFLPVLRDFFGRLSDGRLTGFTGF